VEFLVLLGPPGAGKGTLSRLLQTRTGFLPLSTGEIIRREMCDPQSDFGREARPFMDRGDYVPDELALSLFFTILKEVPAGSRLTLDGFPRTVPQAGVFLEWVRKEGHLFRGCVHLDVSVEAAVQRMRQRRICSRCRAPYHLENRPPGRAGFCDVCGGRLVLREDDDAPRVASRLARFHEQTDPLIGWFAEHSFCLKLDGADDPEDLVRRLMRELSLN